MPKGLNSTDLCEESMTTDIESPPILFDCSRNSANNIIGFDNNRFGTTIN